MAVPRVILVWLCALSSAMAMWPPARFPWLSAAWKPQWQTTAAQWQTPAASFLQLSSLAQKKEAGAYPGQFPGMSPYAAGTRMLTASMGLPPYGMDCCPCLANEEDYRVYPVEPMFLQTGEAATTPVLRGAPKEAGSALLQVSTDQVPGQYAGIVDPGSIQSRMMMAQQGLPPYGMDCCPCLANEEDYRVYPPDL